MAASRGELSLRACRAMGYRCFSAASPGELPDELPHNLGPELASVHRAISDHPQSQYSGSGREFELFDRVPHSYVYGYAWNGETAYAAIDTTLMIEVAGATRAQMTTLVSLAGVVWVIGVGLLECFHLRRLAARRLGGDS